MVYTHLLDQQQDFKGKFEDYFLGLLGTIQEENRKASAFHVIREMNWQVQVQLMSKPKEIL